MRRNLVPKVFGVVVGFGLAFSSPVWAGPIVNAGSDFLETLPGTVFNGIPLTGVPLPGHALADTQVDRLADAHAPSEAIPTELVALQLMSVSPVDLGGGMGLHSLFITLQKVRGGPDSPGRMTINFNVDANNDPVEPPPGDPHGSFSSFFDVFFDVRIDGLSGPIIQSDSGRLTAEGIWCHDDSIPGSFVINCGNAFNEQKVNVVHRVHRVPDGRVPEPSTLLLFGTGLAGLAGVAWRKRRQ